VGRFDDISEDGLAELENIVAALRNYDFSQDGPNGQSVEVIAASIRNPNHVTQAALIGADIATVPFGVLKKCAEHPLTTNGLAAFEADWEKVKQA
jgi:transaldolase